PRSRAELVRLNAQALEHAHVEIAQGWRAVRIEVQMLAMLEAAAGDEYGQILDGMAAAVAEIAAKINHRAVEQCVAGFFRLLQFGQEVVKRLYGFHFDDFELLEL